MFSPFFKESLEFFGRF